MRGAGVPGCRVPGCRVPRYTRGSVSSSFRELFDQHGAAVLRYLRRVTGSRAEAEDILQETFLKLHLQGATAVSLENPRAWIFRVATNLSRDRERHRLVELREAARAVDEKVVDFETRLQRQQLTRRTLRRMPRRMRQVLILWSEGFSYREIADITGIEAGYVGVLLQRARTAFRASYDEQDLSTGSNP